MTIEFTRDQYRALVQLVHLGDWLAHARKPKPDRKDLRAVEQYVLSRAEEFGAGDIVEEDKDELFLSRKMEESLDPLITAYDEDAFWTRLVESLAERDLAAEHGEKGVGRLSDEEYDQQFDERAAVYEDEFREFGVDRLQIVED